MNEPHDAPRSSASEEEMSRTLSDEMAEAINALRAENARLREALESAQKWIRATPEYFRPPILLEDISAAALNQCGNPRGAAEMSETPMTEARDKVDFSPGTMGCHEALHMASFLTGAIDEEILSHPAVEAVPEWKALDQQSFDAMAALYQKIGERHL